jgi:tRNA(fMet)-specific endonuclease VapC
VIEYVLDTNACIALINGSSVTVRSRFKRALDDGGVVCVSAVVLHELWYGVSKSSRRDHNTERVQTFLSGPVEILPFDDADARAAGEVRALLEQAGTPIGAYDALIAGQAVRRGITLVTANVREFARVDGLMWEDWALSG